MCVSEDEKSAVSKAADERMSSAVDSGVGWKSDLLVVGLNKLAFHAWKLHFVPRRSR